MATVQELKDALETEQARAAELAEKAIGAIDTLLNLSTWTLGILAFIVGIIAIFGYSLIASAAKKSAKEVAKAEAATYIKSKDLEDRLEVAIRQEVKERMKDKVIMTYMTEEKGTGKADAFPPIPGVKK